ncbi:putative transcription factor ovo-like protein 3 [Paroedura picta]|uniref:putative transcription factor ovo-like protein 3 n=1 Tax=Paroedura picta TaxID=143630 RepID=UPI004056D5D6
MPKSFLVKSRRSAQREAPDWGELSDQLRGDSYIPESSLVKNRPGPRLLRDAAAWDRSHDDPPSPLDSPQDAVGRHPRSDRGRSSQAAFLCSVCSKRFPLQRMLNRHLKCHNSVKKHVCRYCSKGFNDTFDLKRHLRTHTGIRPFRCLACDKAFTQRCSLESHLGKIHGLQQHYAYRQRRSKLFVCEDCGFTSGTSEDYYRHVHQCHPAGSLMGKATTTTLQNDLHAFYPSPYCG